MRSITILLGMLFICASAHSVTWYVPTNFSTIQAAIDAAANGDTIVVLPGTYVENIDFSGKNVTLQSEQGPEATVIDGGMPADPNYGATVTFRNGEGPGAVLDGFTVTNGTGSWYSTSIPYNVRVGGGVFIKQASPTVVNNIIKNNEAQASGGGLICGEDSSSLILNNVMCGNKAPGTGGGLVMLYAASNATIRNNQIYGNWARVGGGGIGCFYNSDQLIADNRIWDNQTDGDYPPDTEWGGGGIYCYASKPIIINNYIGQNTSLNKGGGIFCKSSASPTIKNNTITDNEAEDGGGLYCYLSAPTVINTRLANNVASERGGGIKCYDNSSMTVVNTTIFGNTADIGGGIICRKNSSAAVVNSILWGNSATTEGPEILLASTTNPSTMSIGYSDVKGGQASAVVKPGCTLDWGAGMIDADPLFADSTAGDLHLTYPSPCRGTGDNAAVTEPTDFEGDPRIASGTVDMGADEFYTHLYYTGDATPGGTVALKLVDVPGTAPVGFWIAFNVLSSPVPGAYGEWYLLPPMVGPITLPSIPSSGVQVLSGMLPLSPPGPYTLYLQGITGTPMKLTNLCTVQVLP